VRDWLGLLTCPRTRPEPTARTLCGPPPTIGPTVNWNGLPVWQVSIKSTRLRVECGMWMRTIKQIEHMSAQWEFFLVRLSLVLSAAITRLLHYLRLHREMTHDITTTPSVGLVVVRVSSSYCSSVWGVGLYVRNICIMQNSRQRSSKQRVKIFWNFSKFKHESQTNVQKLAKGRIVVLSPSRLTCI